MKLLNALKKLLERMGGSGNVVNYLCGSEALPLPLSGEEEAEMLRKLAEGEDAEEVKAKLIEHNLRLVVYISHKFENTGVDQDDLATYASRCIENEILMHLRRTVKLKSEVSFDEPLNTDFEGNELLLSDILGTDSDTVYGGIESGVEKELLREALRKLPERERKIMYMRFGLGGREEMTQKADRLGISQSYISRLEKKIIERLKKEISKFV